MRRAIAIGLLGALFAAGGPLRADDFPEPFDTEPDKAGPMPAAEAAAKFDVPEGFRVGVFASEPEVRNPIAMTWDARGRLWIAENYTYAQPGVTFETGLRDRVVLFEDRDRDGKADDRKVFTDEVQRLTSVEVGRGGVWMVAPPQLLFMPDADGDDRPDGPAQVVLDGFTIPPENYHNFANGLRWGPDGWLYGRCGAVAPGTVGPPGTPDDRRVPLSGGLWRYHPETKAFEPLAHGTTNPWGHDWNALGEPFFINTVNGHLWHAVPGMHFTRIHSIAPNPRVYEPIDQHADHWHWDNSKDWTDSRNVTGEHDRKGGGHAHIGAAIYNADQWPEAYRGRLLTLNLHGKRTNVERLERAGAGYVGKHEPDMLFAGDTWFRGLDLSVGPDGAVYLLDWSDAGECHENTGVHRSSGRIYRITFSEAPGADVGDLSKLDGKALVDLLGHANEWYARQARRLLTDRAARGEPMGDVQGLLRKRFDGETDPVQKLRAMWALYSTGGADPSWLRARLADDHEAIRTWAIRLLTDALPLDDVLGRRPAARPVTPLPDDLLAEFARMAQDDPSGLVRLYLASTLQRLPLAQRPALAAPLMARADDADDHNLPALVWYALAPLADADPSAVARLANGCEWPRTRRWIARRLAEDLATNPAPLTLMVAHAAEVGTPEAFADDLLVGIADGLRGWRKAPKPDGWDALAARLAKVDDSALRDRARDLGVLFGDGLALDEVRRVALDPKSDMNSRRSALRTLIESRPDDLRSVCEQLITTRFLNTEAAKGLALFDDPALGRNLANSYRTFHPSERPALIGTLASRPEFAAALLESMARGTIPRGDLSAFHARQVRGFGDPKLSARLAEVWGELRDSSADKQALIAKYKGKLTPEALAAADPGHGRAVFNKVCASCHRLYGQGQEVGPDLTGSGRENLDYILENILDPSGTVSADFRMVVAATADGRVLNGIVKAGTDRTVTLRTQDETVTLPRDEIQEFKPSTQSLMPEGLVDPLTEADVRDLVAYLSRPTQVPLPPGSEEAPAAAPAPAPGGSDR